MVELRNGKQADQAGIHQPAQQHNTNYNHTDAKRKDSLAYEHETSHADDQPVSNVNTVDDLPRILEEIAEEEKRLEAEQKDQQKQEQEGKKEVDVDHQPVGQLSLPQAQEFRESEQSIPQKRAHSDISLLNFDDDDIEKIDEAKDEDSGEQQEQLAVDATEQPGNEQKEDQDKKSHEEKPKFCPGTGKFAQPSLGTSSKNSDVPFHPPDRRPTPGRINNPRAVNEEGAAPIFSRGLVEEFPWRTDPNYSNRSYMSMDQHGVFHDDDDAPKGPPKKKGRYNNPERLKWEEEQPLVDPNNSDHAYHLCASRGPDGPPTYDRAGYLLDYEKSLAFTRPTSYNKTSIVNGMDRAVNRSTKEQEQMAKLFFEPGAVPEDAGIRPTEANHWRDRVSKDLGVPWHEVGVERFQEWDRKGFPKAKKDEYKNFDQEESERMMSLLKGGRYRVGSKH
ncbi:hypothetical protein HDK64DRAFT_54007 [Phyllosticta capitalensis]